MDKQKKKIPLKKIDSFNASLSIEASLSFCLFFFAVLALVFPLEILAVQNLIQISLDEAASETLSVFSGQEESLVSALFVQEYFQSRIRQRAGPSVVVRGGHQGISLRLSHQEDYLELIARYEVRIPVPLLSIKPIECVQRVKKRFWIGSDFRDGFDENLLYVYQTKTGGVYHINRNCWHLKSEVHQKEEQDIEHVRNKNGAKYHACEVCSSYGNSGSVYITDYGTRYHSLSNCRELKLQIHQVTLQEAEGKSICKDCMRSK
ncbi:hypothetical protein FACS189418_5810 [Clostridia bacterium]|nr:hypothetical protein FACS189418_5810 [Clostridia bacterium]